MKVLCIAVLLPILCACSGSRHKDFSACLLEGLKTYPGESVTPFSLSS